MDGHRKSWMRFPVPWIAALATLVIVPAAWADHDDDDWDDNGRWYNEYEYSPWDDPGRSYDRWGSYDPYWSYHASPYPEFASLQGYGRWSRIPGFRDPVWFPYVEASWRPYFYGHWINTRFGMTWVSYEPWGDVPHHYGHWVFVDHYGWGWVPGWEWGPAWVTWGVTDGYIGWAPLPPVGYRYPRYCHYSPGRHHPDYRWSVSFGYDSSGLDFGLWVFVSDRDFCGTTVYTHAVPSRSTLSFFKEKRVLPVGRDLQVDYVKRVSKAPVHTVELTQRETKTIDGRTLVTREPRGQESKVLAGREATKSIVRKIDDRRTPDRVAAEKTRGDEPSRSSQVVTEKSRADWSSRSEEASDKSRQAPPARSEAVTEKSRQSESGSSREKSAPAPKQSKSDQGQERKVEKRKR